jgi:hypothetical protein
MSDKYKEMAESFLKCCKFFYPGALPGDLVRQRGWTCLYGDSVSPVRLVADAMRFCAAKLEEERSKETCENCVYAGIEYGLDGDEIDCEIRVCLNANSTMCGKDVSEDCCCSKWSRLIVEKESVIAPTSAGGTTKSVAVTPDEGAPK